ncbi:MAG: hypothetical protein ACRDL5_15070, partial [Solirubrobacteraceae bacterium]
SAQAGALPATVAAALGRLPSPQLVVLGGRTLRRYLDAPLAGGRGVASVYLLPTTVGTVTAVCSSASFSARFTATCERVLADVTPPGTVLSLRVDAGYAVALNRILTGLDSVRRHAGPGLASTNATVRAHAASALATASATAAVAAGQISSAGVSPGSVSAANPALVMALTRSAAAYRALATASGGHDAAVYGSAEAAVAAAERALAGAFAQLRALGYGVA